MVVAAAATSILSLYGIPAFADSHSEGALEGSSGVTPPEERTPALPSSVSPAVPPSAEPSVELSSLAETGGGEPVLLASGFAALLLTSGAILYRRGRIAARQ